MSLDKLKLNKQLVTAMTDAGYLTPKEVQLKAMSRMLGGQDVVVAAPEGSGKTTAYVLALIMRLKYALEEAPRALVLVPDKESVEAVLAKFELLDLHKSLRVLGIYHGVGLETQLNLLTDGVDVVVATPDRARTVYLKLGLNLNKIQTFIVDDAASIVKNGLQLPVAELARSLPKCQHLVFSDVLHDRVQKMIAPFMHFPTLMEIDELPEQQIEIYPQQVYHLPNFRTKLNLLNHLIDESGQSDKIVVFVNTRLNADRVFKSLLKKNQEQAAVLKPVFFDTPGLESFADFKEIEELKVLIVAHEVHEPIDLGLVSQMIHFELPEEKETLVGQIVKGDSAALNVRSVVFTTDAELSMLRKVEQAVGQKLPVHALPENLLIEKDVVRKSEPEVVAQKEEEAKNAAFHEKKASNAKDYNYSSREKAKMSGKIRSRRKS